jgi:hypothetical protein
LCSSDTAKSWIFIAARARRRRRRRRSEELFSQWTNSGKGTHLPFGVPYSTTLEASENFNKDGYG